MSQSFRAYLILAIVNVCLLARSIAIYDNSFSVVASTIVAIFVSTIITILTSITNAEYLLLYMKIITFLVCAISIYLFLRVKSNLAQILLIFVIIGISIVSSLIVNPIRRGVGVIYDVPIVQKMEEIVNQDESLWIVEGIGYPITNLPIMVGAKTINSTNIYPNLELWEKLDGGKNKNIYNRYAHIAMDIVQEETAFELLNPDYLHVKLNVMDLSKLNIKYIVTANELENFDNESVKFDLIDSNNNLSIYQVEYK
jgi:hypothetical protein